MHADWLSMWGKTPNLLAHLACRGVVRLFNAVAKAQKQQEEAKEGKSKGAPQLSRAAFLAELQGKLAKPQVLVAEASTSSHHMITSWWPLHDQHATLMTG